MPSRELDVACHDVEGNHSAVVDWTEPVLIRSKRELKCKSMVPCCDRPYQRTAGPGVPEKWERQHNPDTNIQYTLSGFLWLFSGLVQSPYNWVI